MEIRDATELDVPKLIEIYRPSVLDSATSFETEVPSVEEFTLRLRENQKSLPWLVMEKQGEIAGYAYASLYRHRCAYAWSVESSVYIAKKFQRQGVGRALYLRLIEILKAQSIINIFAGTTLPNEGSVSLHESLGFRKIGVYEKVGFKFGKWWDVGWWQLEFDRPESPEKFIRYPDLEKGI